MLVPENNKRMVPKYVKDGAKRSGKQHAMYVAWQTQDPDNRGSVSFGEFLKLLWKEPPKHEVSKKKKFTYEQVEPMLKRIASKLNG